MQSSIFQHPSQQCSLNSCPPCPLLLCFTQEICNVTGLRILSGPSPYLPAGLAGFCLTHGLIWKQTLEISCSGGRPCWYDQWARTVLSLDPTKNDFQGNFPTHTHIPILPTHTHTHTRTRTHGHRSRWPQPQWILLYALDHLAKEEAAFTSTNTRSNLWGKCVLM